MRVTGRALREAALAHSSTRRGLNEGDTNLKRMCWCLACVDHMIALIETAEAEDNLDQCEESQAGAWIAAFSDTIYRPLAKGRGRYRSACQGT